MDTSAFRGAEATHLPPSLSSSHTVRDSGIALTAARVTVLDSNTTHPPFNSPVPDDSDGNSTVTVSARITAPSTVTTATASVLGAVYTPDSDAHGSSVRIGVIADANPSIRDDIDVEMAPPAPERDPALFDGKSLFLFLMFDIQYIYVIRA